MATRFYLPSSGAAAISPSFDAGWEKTSDADRIKCVTSKLSTSMTNKSCFTQNADDDYDALNRQYVSDQLIGNQTIDASATIRGQIRCLESNSLANFSYAIVAKVVSSDGTTIRGTLLSDFSDTGAEFNNSSLTNRSFPASTTVAAQVNALNGDRIVFEIGIRKNGTSSSTRTATLSYGDDNASDLPVDESEQTALNPWIELSTNLVFTNATDLTWNPDWIPDFVFTQSYEFDTIVTESRIGPERRRPRRSVSIGIFTLNFSNISKALATSIYNFYIESKGPFRPFVWANPVDGLTYNVRFLENELSREEVGEDLMNLEVKLRQVI